MPPVVPRRMLAIRGQGTTARMVCTRIPIVRSMHPLRPPPLWMRLPARVSCVICMHACLKRWCWRRRVRMHCR
jgi:hypothetical protein